MKKGLLHFALFSMLMGANAPTLAVAWDGHGILTRRAMLSFKTRKPELWKMLHKPMTVTPLESFLTKAFGPQCTYAVAASAIFKGLGKGYKVLYTEGVDSDFEIDWLSGTNRQINLPFPADPMGNAQALGRSVTPESVLATYVDEPDWGADDDVPELRGKGLGQAGEGTATRLLRHFWYEGETHFGLDFGKDQETDQRMQLFYRLALIAFAVDEPYWGYRFLGNALHYLQDLTQPFHARAVISEKLIDKFAFVRAALCEMRSTGEAVPEECSRPQDTMDAAVIQSSWVVGSYHALYEDYVRGMITHNTKAGYASLSDFGGHYEKQGLAEKLIWNSASGDTAGGELLDLLQTIRSAQRAILGIADPVGHAVYEAFGTKFRFHSEETRKAILAAGKPQSLGYRIGRANYHSDRLEMTSRQEIGERELAALTRNVLVRLGVWTRQFIERSLGSVASKRGAAATESLRRELALKCQLLH